MSGGNAMTKNTFGRITTKKLGVGITVFLLVTVFANATERKQTDESSYWAWGALLFGFVILYILIKLYQARSAQDKAMRDIFSDED